MRVRRVEPEWLDRLPAADPRAQRSRRDLARLNRLMGHSRIVGEALQGSWRAGARIADLGAGDGAFMAQVADGLRPRPAKLELALVDKAAAFAPPALAKLRGYGWQVALHGVDALEWLQQGDGYCEAIFANLFLHHFEDPALARLLEHAAQRTVHFVSCEPRRSRIALTASGLVRLAGCSATTQDDAQASVRAGFLGQELSALWPAGKGWNLTEGPRGAFSHAFIARRHGAL